MLSGSARVGLSRARPSYVVIAVLGLSPILIAVVLRLPIINQLNYADAWFYSAYAWAPKHHFAVFGWNYFSVRFPAILVIGVFERVFGAGDGYVLLRWALAVACGASVYVCVRRFASIRVALGAAVLLYLNPFFSRMLLWDYSGFIEVAGGTIGVALWYWSDCRRLAWTILPGIAFACAVFANALVGTVLLVLLPIEAIAALRQGRRALWYLGRRLAIVAGASLGVFVTGYLGYRQILGSLSPYDLLRPTINFFGENSKQSAPYQQPVSVWLLHEPRIWAPVITSVALIAVLRRRILGTDIPARVAQMCVCYTAFLWVYRFTVTSSVVEVWWAYSVVVVAAAPAIGLLLHELADERRTAGFSVAIAGGTFALTAMVVRNLAGPAGDAYHSVAQHRVLVIALLVAGTASACLVGSRSIVRRTSALVVFITVLALASYAPSVLDGRGTIGIFVTSGSQEWKAYQGGKRFIDLMREYDNPKRRVFLWYPGLLGYVSIAWLDLPQTGDTLNVVGASEPLDHLTPLGAARIRLPQVAYVMLLAPRENEVRQGNEALTRGGFGGSVVRQGEFADGGLHFQLVAITSK